MSQRAAITINDGASTPAAHTFNPLSTAGSGDWIEFFDSSGGGISAGRWILRIRSKMVTPTDTLRASGNVRNNLINKVEAQVLVPVLETVGTASSGFDAVPSPAYHLTAKVEFFLPDRASTQERDHIITIVKNLLGHTVMQNAVESLDVPY
jgi:hypothetical protein